MANIVERQIGEDNPTFLHLFSLKGRDGRRRFFQAELTPAEEAKLETALAQNGVDTEMSPGNTKAEIISQLFPGRLDLIKSKRFIELLLQDPSTSNSSNKQVFY